MSSLQDLIKARVHFGHRKSRWHPKMLPYIWGEKNDVHLIDIAKTSVLLERAARFLESIAADGKQILWVGTKKAAQNCISDTARELNDPCVTHRWIGGTLTNYSQVKKSVTKFLHLQDIIAKADQFNYTKKELNKFQKNVGRLDSNVGGISTMHWPVGALVVVDIQKEHAAVREALRSGVPVVALVDTNVDPTGIDYIIPANDDAASSITFIVNYLKEAVAEGQKKGKELKKSESEPEHVEETVLDVYKEPVEKTSKSFDESVKAKPAARKKPARTKLSSSSKPIAKKAEELEKVVIE